MRVVVTGAGRGIGAAIARRFAGEGARVLVSDKNEEAAGLTAQSIGNGSTFQRADVTREDDVEALMEQAHRHLGGLDALVHAPAIGGTKLLADVTAAEWKHLMAVNLTGAFLCCRAAGRAMARQRSGVIVTLASLAAHRPSAGTGPYSASKAALVHFTLGLAAELRPFGVRANVVSPGPTETELAKSLHSPSRRAALTSRVPMARYGTPEEIAAAAVFLCSNDARLISGTVLHVDGGASHAGVTSM